MSQHSRVLVTGIGRSGTAYMAKLLTAAGIACGHEHLYDSRTRRAPNWGNVRAESSWCAVPWLAGLPDDVFVVHVVRNPMKWLSSWVFTCWNPGRRTARTTKYITKHTGVPWRRQADVDVIDSAMRLWMVWNELITSHMQIRVEDVDRLLKSLLCSVNVDPCRADEALACVPRNVNQREHRAISWKDCKEKPAAGRFAIETRKFGYDVHERKGLGRS